MDNLLTNTPETSLEKLKEGNERFVNGTPIWHHEDIAERRKKLLDKQAPFATVLGCSDSRAPVELVFDAGPGDLFICRNAGNILDDTILGSIEYAVLHTGCPLVVIMGHSSCGAITAAVNHFRDGGPCDTPHIHEIMNHLMPAVHSTEEKGVSDIRKVVHESTVLNIQNVCLEASRKSRVLSEKLENGEIGIVGAFYDLAEGKVDFLG